MTFTCKYCEEKFCSSHRLPENHDCDGLEEGVKEEKEEDKKKNQKWFQEKEVREELKAEPSKKKRRKTRGKTWLAKEAFRSLRNNATLSIIGFTTLVFLIQASLGTSPTSISFYELFILDPGLKNILTKPWTLLTVLFLHGGTFHLFANMITLYFFGRPVENITGPKEFLKFYFGAGIAASLGFVIARNLMVLYQGSGALGPAVGASGAVIACFAAVSMLYPEAEVLLYFFIPMKIKTALYAFGGLEAFNLAAKFLGMQLPVIGGFASSAHLTGLIIGIWYGRKLREKRGAKTSVLELLGAQGI